MTDSLVWILGALGAGHYRPSSYALASDPIMMMLFVSAWTTTSVACMAIGATLMWRRWKHITMSANAASVYGAMFLLIGFDFFMSAVTVFVAVYRLKVVILGLTAAVTVTVAIATISRIFGAARDNRGI